MGVNIFNHFSVISDLSENVERSKEKVRRKDKLQPDSTLLVMIKYMTLGLILSTSVSGVLWMYNDQVTEIGGD